MKGSSALSIAAVVPRRVTGTRWICPSRTKTTVCPLGESIGAPPSTTRHAPLPFVFAVQIARSAPSGLLLELAIQPSVLGAEPRTKVTTDPSSEMARSDRTTPSSSRNFVRRTGLKSGAAAA